MERYSAERKESVIQKMMPPHNTPIPELAAETGISDVTLYTWRKQARVEGIAVPADGKNPAHGEKDPCANRRSDGLAIDHSIGGPVESHVAWLGKLLSGRER